MAKSIIRQLPTWVTAIAAGAVLLASFPSAGTGQDFACDVDHIGALPIPEIRISEAKAALRVAPERDSKVVVTLPRDIDVALLDQADGWYVVSYLERDQRRRLYVSTQDAEGPAAASLEPRQVQVQEWASEHTRACEKIARQSFATKSLAAATVIAGLTSVIWHVYVDDDDHYGTAFAVWSGLSVASLAGTVYKAFVLSRAKGALADIGPPSSVGEGLLPGIGGARADLQFDAATRRLAVVATWRP